MSQKTTDHFIPGDRVRVHVGDTHLDYHLASLDTLGVTVTDLTGRVRVFYPHFSYDRLELLP